MSQLDSLPQLRFAIPEVARVFGSAALPVSAHP
jgi:hypothetical protein